MALTEGHTGNNDVMPAKAGIQDRPVGRCLFETWIAAFAGMTTKTRVHWLSKCHSYRHRFRVTMAGTLALSWLPVLSALLLLWPRHLDDWLLAIGGDLGPATHDRLSGVRFDDRQCSPAGMC